MKLGKVIGQVIAPQKTDNLNGLKLVLARYLDEYLIETSKTSVCVDTVNANTGDVVLLVSSSSARKTEITQNVCTDHTIVGIVDIISKGRKNWYLKSR
ncbi:MAG TPA: ethanolamine utilization protein EutN [Bacteroidetes bacterium]|nr:ethanolamine utilization protein EutN [Bacteroidota bacterium]